MELAPRRIEAIDAVRGGVMVLMALDHVRDFIHRGAMSYSPTDLTQTTPILFFTRWVTHFCAPTFMFTAGLGAFLWWQRGKTRQELSAYLVSRGLWLIVLEVTVMRLAYYFDFSPDYPVLLLVLWVLGACMIGLALLVWIPIRALTIFSVAVIVLHNSLDRVDAARFGAAAGIWNLLHQPGAFRLAGATIVVGYPLVPWIAVMALGFCFGQLYLLDRRGAAATPCRDRDGGDSGVRGHPCFRCLWRSGTLDGADIRRLHGTLLPEHHQVSTIPRLPPHDAGSGDACPGLG